MKYRKFLKTTEKFSAIACLIATVVSGWQCNLGHAFSHTISSESSRNRVTSPNRNLDGAKFPYINRFLQANLEEITPPTLASLAQNRNLLIGSAVNLKVLRKDALYRASLAREFNLVTAENEMKFAYLRPELDRFDFTEADYLVNFANSHQMKVRGHTLVWHRALPDWLKEGNWTRDELLEILETHIKTVVGRYRGQIVAWDVVNEAIADVGTLRNSFWLENIGPEYIELAFRWAHEADPDALLMYNDYGGEGLNYKSDAIYRLVKSLLDKNVPIHGVGFQMHVSVNNPPNAREVEENMRRLAELGLQVQITEMDVRIEQPATANDFDRQAEVYRTMLRVCLIAENCNTFVTWGFSDRYSWIPGHFEGWGDALLFDRDFQPKPAYYGLLEELETYGRKTP